MELLLKKNLFVELMISSWRSEKPATKSLKKGFIKLVFFHQSGRNPPVPLGKPRIKVTNYCLVTLNG